MASQVDLKASEQLQKIAKPWDGKESVKPVFFSMHAQLLDAGNTEEPLAVGEHLWLKIKVYAKGGENKLHAHPHQDHSFIVLDGRARFYGPGVRNENFPGMMEFFCLLVPIIGLKQSVKNLWFFSALVPVATMVTLIQGSWMTENPKFDEAETKSLYPIT